MVRQQNRDPIDVVPSLKIHWEPGCLIPACVAFSVCSLYPFFECISAFYEYDGDMSTIANMFPIMGCGCCVYGNLLY